MDTPSLDGRASSGKGGPALKAEGPSPPAPLPASAQVPCAWLPATLSPASCWHLRPPPPSASAGSCPPPLVRSTAGTCLWPVRCLLEEGDEVRRPTGTPSTQDSTCPHVLEARVPPSRPSRWCRRPEGGGLCPGGLLVDNPKFTGRARKSPDLALQGPGRTVPHH